jgi:hypothetical protein
MNQGSTQQEGEYNIFTHMQIRKVRNTLLAHAKKKEVNFIPRNMLKLNIRSDNQSCFGLGVQPKSLYSMVFRSFNLYKKEAKGETTAITSGASIVNNNDKRSLLQNFFNINYLKHQFNSQNLEPNWSFDYTDKFNVSFIGKRKSVNFPR